VSYLLTGINYILDLTSHRNGSFLCGKEGIVTLTFVNLIIIPDRQSLNLI
jgi:hypothetical protein